MTLMQHLYELRTRLFKAAIALVIAGVLAFVFFQPIFGFLIHPYCSLPTHVRDAGVSGGCHLIAYSVFDQFNVRLKVSAIVAIVFAAPVWLFQLWRFITPALHRSERRWTVSFTVVGSLLFFAGAAMAYYVLGKGLELLLTIAGNNVTTLLDVSSYLRYVVAMLAVFGLALEFPLLLTALNFAGILSYARMRSWWRGIVFAIFAFTAVATPSPSPVEMTALALVMCALFGVVLVIARTHDARKQRRLAAEGLTGLADDETSPLVEPPEPVEPPPPDDERDFTDIS